MATINGKAKRFNGEPVDYVMFFDWFDGQCIGKAVPDLEGNWSFRYYNNQNIGITYVADGCEPITHGSYATVVQTPNDTILHYPFDGDTKDYSSRSLNGVKEGSVSFMDGRIEGTKAAYFINGCVKTPSSLFVNSVTATISFWIKPVSLTGVAVIAEIGATFSSSQSFLIAINDPEAGDLSSAHGAGGITHAKTTSSKVTASWTHVVVDIDKSRPANDETRIYVNNINVTTSFGGNDNDTDGVLNSGILYIGKRNGNTLPLHAYLQDFRIYNRTLTEIERTQLFNE